MKQPKDSTEMIMVPVEKVNITAFLTLPYFLAPQLYAQTGWKPCLKDINENDRRGVEKGWNDVCFTFSGNECIEKYEEAYGLAEGCGDGSSCCSKI